MTILNETLKKIDLQTCVEDGASDVNLIQRRTKVVQTAAFNQIMLEHEHFSVKRHQATFHFIFCTKVKNYKS